MHKRIKLLVTALIAVFACSLAAGTATANRSIRIAGGPNVTSESRLTFFGEGEGRAREITCDITLLRTIGSVIPKTRGTLFGKVTGIAINRGGTTRSPRCGHGSFIREVHDIIPLRERGVPGRHVELGGGVLLWTVIPTPHPLWKLVFDSFQGTLPGIEGINFHIQGSQFSIVILEPFGGTSTCLYVGDSFGLIVVRAATIREARAVEALTRLPLETGGGLCPARGSFQGNFTVRPTLTITLA